jgi:hypothetical protein
MLQQLIWKILPPFEVKVTSEEISAFLTKHANSSKSIIERGTSDLLKDVDKAIYSIRIEGVKPEHLALLLITNVTGEHLSMGNYHVYRGVLNIVGNNMLAVFSHAVQLMQERGYQSSEEADEDMQWVHRQIAGAG